MFILVQCLIVQEINRALTGNKKTRYDLSSFQFDDKLNEWRFRDHKICVAATENFKWMAIYLLTPCQNIPTSPTGGCWYNKEFEFENFEPIEHQVMN